MNWTRFEHAFARHMLFASLKDHCTPRQRLWMNLCVNKSDEEADTSCRSWKPFPRLYNKVVNQICIVYDSFISIPFDSYLNALMRLASYFFSLFLLSFYYKNSARWFWSTRSPFLSPNFTLCLYLVEIIVGTGCNFSRIPRFSTQKIVPIFKKKVKKTIILFEIDD